MSEALHGNVIFRAPQAYEILYQTNLLGRELSKGVGERAVPEIF